MCRENQVEGYYSAKCYSMPMPNSVQGFRYSKLVKSFKKFYVKYIHLMDNYNVCLRRHISEGICPPYIRVPVLFKHVTTRKP